MSYVKDGSTWYNVATYINDSGTWWLTLPYINDSGTWKPVGLLVTMPNIDVGFSDPFFGSGFATLAISSAGTYAASSDTTGTGEYGADSGTWMTAGTNTDFEVRLTGTGDTPSGRALNTWLATSTTRSWTITNPGSTTMVFIGTLEFRIAGDSTVISTSSVTLNTTSS